MKSSILPRLLGAIAIHGAAGVLLWLFVRYAIGKQDSLAPGLLDRLDGDPARIQTYIDDVTGKLLVAGLGAMAVAAVLACLWLILIHRNPPYGDASARGKRGSWAGLLIAALLAAAALFWFTVMGAPIAGFMAANVAINCLGVAVALVIIAYWLATAALVPASTKSAVPLASMLFRG